MGGNSTPTQITASLRRLGIPTNQRTQEWAALELIIAELVQQVGRLAIAAKELSETAKRMERG